MKKTYKTSFLAYLIKKLSLGRINLEIEIIYKSEYIEINSFLYSCTIKYENISYLDTEENKKIKIYCTDSEIIYLKFLHQNSIKSIKKSIDKYISIYNNKEQLRIEEVRRKEKEAEEEKERKLQLKLQHETEIALEKQKNEEKRAEEEKKRKLQLKLQHEIKIALENEEKRKENIREIFNKHKNVIDKISININKVYEAKKYFSGSQIIIIKELLSKNTEMINHLLHIYEKDILENNLDRKINNISYIVHNLDKFIIQVREKFLNNSLKDNQSFFNSINKFGLKYQQQIACLTNNDYNLVIAGAGSGKTLVMLARAAYLIKEKIVNSSNILILAYNAKAKIELKSRSKEIYETKGYYNKKSKNIATFHSLGKSILETVDKKTYIVIREAKQKDILKKALSELMNNNKEFIDKIFTYFKFYIYPLPDVDKYGFKSLGEYAQFMKLRSIKPINPDNEPFGTYDECIIANFLYFNDIKYEVGKFVEGCEKLKFSFYLIDFDIYIFYEKEKFSNIYYSDNTLKFDCLKNKKYFIIHSKDCISPPVIEQKTREEIEFFNISFETLTSEKIIEKIEKSNVINEFIRLLKQFLSLYKNSSENKITQLKEEYFYKNTISSKRITFFIEIFESILNEYEKALKINGEIDFDDMIFRANKYVKDGLYISPYDYIMIDEFQDISYARAELIKNLLKMSKQPNLFCVGDDWQAIYRFSGSELKFVTNFGKEFSNNDKLSYSKTLLDYTFRFNDKILTTSSNFIQQNNYQEKKKINVLTNEKRQKVNIILKNSELTENILNKILSKIKKRKTTTEKTEVLILSRYHNYKGIKDSREEIEKYFEEEVSLKFEMKIRYASIHSSKGQEADYVILIDVKAGFKSFPSMRDSDEIIEMMLPEKETNIDFAEERRLMYVAITRAKKEVWIESDYNEMSPFIKELIEKKDYFKVRTLNLTNFIDKYNIVKKQIKCPICVKGTIIEKVNNSGAIFYSCNNFPSCNYTLKRCLECHAESSIIRESKTRYFCFNCNNKFKVCSDCNDGIRTLKIYNNPDGSIKNQIYCSNNKLLTCRPKDKGIEFHPETDVIFPNLELNKIILAKK